MLILTILIARFHAHVFDVTRSCYLTGGVNFITALWCLLFPWHRRCHPILIVVNKIVNISSFLYSQVIRAYVPLPSHASFVKNSLTFSLTLSAPALSKKSQIFSFPSLMRQNIHEFFCPSGNNICGCLHVYKQGSFLLGLDHQPAPLPAPRSRHACTCRWTTLPVLYFREWRFKRSTCAEYTGRIFGRFPHFYSLNTIDSL